MVVPTRKQRAAADAANLLIGAGLFLSPPLFGLAGEPAGWATVIGLLLMTVAASALLDLHIWEAWTDAALGLLALAAPWAGGFSTQTTATGVHVLAGLAITAIVVVRWSLDHWAGRDRVMS